MKDLASDVLRDEAAAAVEAAGDVGPVGKLQALLTKVNPKNVGLLASSRASRNLGRGFEIKAGFAIDETSGSSPNVSSKV